MNPYSPPQHAAKPTAADAKDLQYRDILIVVLLSTLTLFIGYPIYLCYQWARELNGVVQRVKYPPVLVVVLCIVTLGLAAIIYESIFAQELEQEMQRRGRKDATPHLMAWVTALNCIAIVASLTVVGILIAIPCGIAATCLVQHEINKLALGLPAKA
jgi:hypothetical protein